MTHTPGPWAYTLENGELLSGGSNYLIANKEWKWIAEVPVPLHSIPWPKEEAIANARLIAAAPELFEACKIALEALNGLHGASPAVNAIGKIVCVKYIYANVVMKSKKKGTFVQIVREQ